MNLDSGSVRRATTGGPERLTAQRVPGVAIAVLAASILAIYDVLAGPAVVVAGLIAVGPCLAATSGGRRAVLGVGGYTFALILLVSWPDEIWWTRQQLLYLLGAVAVTAVSAVIADRRARQEEYIRVVQGADIELRRAGDESRRIAQYARSLIEASVDPLVTINADGRITDVNAATEKVTGVPRTELVGTEFSNYFTDPVQAKFGYQRVFSDESVTDYPLTIRRRDGRLTDVLYNASVFRDADGAVLGVFAAARDVTAQKQAEASFQGLLEGAPDAIVVVDGEGVIQIVNRQTESLFGYPREEILGKSIEVLVPDRVKADHRGLRANYLVDPVRRPMGAATELNGRRRDGSEFPAEVSLAPVETPRGTYVAAAVRDVTVQNQARAEIVRANQAKSEFLSRMSHELRTPLNAILGFGQLLEMDELRPDQAGGVRYILEAGRHLLGLINEILDITQVESGTLRLSLEPVFVPEVIDEAIRMIRPLADHRDIRIVRDAMAADAHVQADRQRFKQVIVNLLANAVKYNRAAGEVRIQGATRPAGRFRVTISDSGPGITENDLKRLFQPFERLNAGESQVEGTGLGLVLARQLMTAMAGEIGVTSRIGEGSSFFIDLPSTSVQSIDGALTASDDLDDVPTPAPGRSMTVMYVEDNLSNVRLVEQVMTRRPGVSLMVAMQGRLALELALEHLPDLILLDLHLPDIQGDDVLRRLKDDPRTAPIPVVMLSADATHGRLERLVADGGAADYLTKPFDVSRLLAVIDTLGAPNRLHPTVKPIQDSQAV